MMGVLKVVELLYTKTLVMPLVPSVNSKTQYYTADQSLFVKTANKAVGAAVVEEEDTVAVVGVLPIVNSLLVTYRLILTGET
jgi:hypothetical protein